MFFSSHPMQPNYTELINLASERLGGAVLYANDDFFASKDNLLKDSDPIFIPDKYTDRGKWMDGWESRRRRTPGFDWSLIRLGLPGRIRQIVVDTSFFRGNYPEHCSIEACEVDGNPTIDDLSAESLNWKEILPQVPLSGDYQNQFEIDDLQRTTHLRFKIYPDGGVARLRVYGDVLPDKRRLLRNNIDLASVENGASIVDCSDKFFGHPLNLIMPGHARNMSEGWETRRRRGPGYDWAVVKLAGRGLIDSVEIDTSHFKGNYPDSCTVEGCDRGAGLTLASPPDWHEILGPVKLQPHTRHVFADDLSNLAPITHVRLNIFPDGGVSRLRVYGKLIAKVE
jgi:allantoicase